MRCQQTERVNGEPDETVVCFLAHGCSSHGASQGTHHGGRCHPAQGAEFALRMMYKLVHRGYRNSLFSRRSSSLGKAHEENALPGWTGRILVGVSSSAQGTFGPTQWIFYYSLGTVKHHRVVWRCQVLSLDPHIWRRNGDKEINITFIRRAERAR